jgi:hypothetical protein
MRRYTFPILAISTVLVICSAVAAWITFHQTQPTEKASSPAINQPEQKSDSELPVLADIDYSEVRSIREIDFRNFTYPGTIIGGERCYTPETIFTLRDGKYGEQDDGVTLKNVSYGDLTGDGQMEAIVNFRMDTDGTLGANLVYIFTIENKKPEVLWVWESGDRAAGGLRRIYAERGRLVVETYGNGTSLSPDDITADNTGLCCPKHFTRTRYEWIDEDFQHVGKMEVFPMTGSR